MENHMRAFDNLFFSADELCNIIGGDLFLRSDRPIRGLITDSRSVCENNVFLALRGENTDGHKYLDDAIAKGASCVITEEVISPRADVSVIVVKNTLCALGALGHWYREHNNAKVIAITGSVGKTTTKQYVYAVLAQQFSTLKTEGNYNNEIGVPLTLLNLDTHHERAVLEMGMNHRSEMHRLSMIARPDIALITNIGSSHIENLGSRDGICDAKLEIIDGMAEGAPLIINADEPLLMAKAHEMRARGAKIITVSKDDPINDFYISDVSVTTFGDSFSLTRTATGETFRNIHISQTGEHNVLNAAMAWVVGTLNDMDEEKLRAGLLAFKNTGMRQNIYSKDGICIIEDCYNASPESMEASLKVLHAIAEEEGGRAIAVLGDMLELGSFTRSLHERVGKAVVDNSVDRLYTFGKLGTHIAQGSISYGMNATDVSKNEDLSKPEMIADALLRDVHKGDTVLFKASRAVRMERVVRAFTDALNDRNKVQE